MSEMNLYIQNPFVVTTESNVDRFNGAASVLDIKSCVSDSNLRRRMNLWQKLGVYSASLSLKNIDVNSIDAIYISTGVGSLADTEKFMSSVYSDSPLSPTHFMQSTFSTLGGLISINTGYHGEVQTFSHRERSVETALLAVNSILTNNKDNRILMVCSDDYSSSSKSFLDMINDKETDVCEFGSSFLLRGEPSFDKDNLSVKIEDIKFGSYDEMKSFASSYSDVVVDCNDFYTMIGSSLGICKAYKIISEKSSERVSVFNSIDGKRASVICITSL